ncbi:hypothetical protein ACJMK2_039244 [Sinanodonta woodiana]|uniref:AIG1-type G domain-containing protein n=1 Tax=Sinanodonta woodiana TaxID=1069815 RepID=A0ABD3WBD9_SINWO
MLGKTKFRTEGLQIESITVSFEVGTAEVRDKKITVLDTPGAMGTSKVQPNLQEELAKFTFDYLRPSPHVFLLTIRADAKFTEEEAKAVKIFTDVFGEALYSHLIVVFTHKSALDKTTKRSMIVFANFLMILLQNFTNTKDQVMKLLKVVEKVVNRNLENWYSEEMMKDDEEACKVRIAKIEQEKEVIENNRITEEQTNNQNIPGRAITLLAVAAGLVAEAIGDS